MLQDLDIACHAGHDHARLLVGEKVERQTLDVGVDPDSQVVHHLSGELARVAHPGPLHEHGEHDRDEVNEAADHDDVEVALLSDEPVVDADLGQVRPGLEPDGLDGEKDHRKQGDPPTVHDHSRERERAGVGCTLGE